jgi:Tol biopolymer transport system component
MGGNMSGKKLNYFELEIVNKINDKLKEMEHMTSLQEIKGKIHKLIDFIEEETASDKEAFEEMIYSKVKETNGKNSDLNTHLYMLYRNLIQNKITLHEAQKIYEMYMTSPPRA